MRVTPFAREVKRLRSEQRLTVRQLAAELGKSFSYIGKIEAGGEIPTPDLILKMAEVLRADFAELFDTARESLLSAYTREVANEYRYNNTSGDQLSNLSIPNTKEGEKNMATVVSLINMKGGVGKTTLAMQLAHTADTMDIKTLAIDLDPQSNLSQALLGPKKYYSEIINLRKPTVVQVFDDYIPTDQETGSPRLLNINDIIIKKAGYWSDSTMDLIPSRLELSRTLKNPHGKERRLAKTLAQIKDMYDLIIIDCAPTESVLTEATYFASRYIIVPIKPEFMATIGLPLLARSLKEFRLENEDHLVEIAGLVFNHSSSYTSGPEGTRSIRDVTKIATENNWYVCENQVKYSASYAKSAREGVPLDRTSYARGSVIQGFQLLAEEIFGLIKIQKEHA